MSVSNPPVKHHFIPQFLLSRWALNDGKLWRFARPVEGKISRKRVAPAGVGYRPDLYATPGVTDENRQWLEQRFMSPLDSKAADAHRMLLSGKSEDMPQEERSAWSRFIMSLWFRTPTGLKNFKDAISNLPLARDEPLEARYSQVREEGHPDTLQDLIKSMGPGFLDRAAMELFRRMSDDLGNGFRLSNMEWSVVDVAGGGDLVVSDAALQHSRAGVFTQNGYMTLPIAPDRLFVATNRTEIMRAIHGLTAAALVERNNHVVVRRASVFVGAVDLTQATFIEGNFGAEEHETYIKSLADAYRADAMRKRP